MPCVPCGRDTAKTALAHLALWLGSRNSLFPSLGWKGFGGGGGGGLSVPLGLGVYRVPSLNPFYLFGYDVSAGERALEPQYGVEGSLVSGVGSGTGGWVGLFFFTSSQLTWEDGMEDNPHGSPPCASARAQDVLRSVRSKRSQHSTAQRKKRSTTGSHWLLHSLMTKLGRETPPLASRQSNSRDAGWAARFSV